MLSRIIFDSFLTLVLFGIFATRAFSGGGSAYSLFGVGELRFFASERSAGMGGTYAGLLETNSINTLNPAAWTTIARTRFSIGVSYDGYAISNTTTSTFLSSATFNGFAMAVPISSDHGIVASLGLTPYSVVNYNIVTPVADPTFPYTLKNIGSGGLSTMHIGVSSRPASQWHLGLKFNYLVGTIHHTTAQEFQSPQLTEATVDRATELRGGALTVGTIFSGVGDWFNMPEHRSISAGVVFTTGSELSTSVEHFYRYASGGITVARDTVLVQEGETVLPFSIGVGLSYTLKDQFIASGDFTYQNWDRFRMMGDHPAELRNNYRFGLGAEILPRRDAAATYWERISYQFGLFYHATNLRVNGRDINEGGITGGIGLPLFSDTRLTLTASYSIRGTVAIERDDIVRVALTLNAGEVWFVRPPEE